MTDRYLADTHVLLWFMHGDPRLAPRHRGILESDAVVFVSIATLWEIAIKVSRGKLKTIDRPAEQIVKSGFRLLPIEPAHVEVVAGLEDHHRDPFDRMLIAQAIAEGLTILTTDAAFARYDLAVV